MLAARRAFAEPVGLTGGAMQVDEVHDRESTGRSQGFKAADGRLDDAQFVNDVLAGRPRQDAGCGLAAAGEEAFAVLA
jgi:hypothetical protein